MWLKLQKKRLRRNSLIVDLKETQIYLLPINVFHLGSLNKFMASDNEFYNSVLSKKENPPYETILSI